MREISGSASHFWKHENPEKYAGPEFSKSIQNNLEGIKVFLDSYLYFSRKAFLQFVRLYITLIICSARKKPRKKCSILMKLNCVPKLNFLSD